MRRICIFTATRAEWGLLRGVAEEIRKRNGLELRLLVSGTHLSGQHGRTVVEIEADGYATDACVDILGFDDSLVGTCQTMGKALGGYGEALTRLQPDMLVVLGDRYEAFCAAAAAHVCRIPVAHIHGGETTEGAIDEAFRHSITKMAQLHFAACEEYRTRIIQLGEQPDRVFSVGALGVEKIRSVPLMTREELARSLDFDLDGPYFLVTFHPVTLEQSTAGEQFENLLGALGQFPDHKFIITGANADPEGSVINDRIHAFAKSAPERCMAVESLGLRRCLSAMNHCDAVVGNSSSGIIEAPAFRVPTVNIGDRQKGRVRAASIIDCPPVRDAIAKALEKALDPGFRASLETMPHPCEKEGTARNIVDIVGNVDLVGLMKKSFYNLPGEAYV